MPFYWTMLSFYGDTALCPYFLEEALKELVCMYSFLQMTFSRNMKAQTFANSTKIF